MSAGFLLDASGFGRVLPRLLQLESPSGFPVRSALFTHVEDRIPSGEFDRNKILISVHPEHVDVWYWTIPFSNGRCSQGVVARKEFLDGYAGDEITRLRTLVGEEPGCALLADARWDTPARQIAGYSANVSSLWGNGYALLGNAGEFLDPCSPPASPLPSSRPAAADCTARRFAGEAVDWEAEFARPLKAGVDCFRTFVEARYEGRFQKLIFHPDATDEIRRMISAIGRLRRDRDNPFVTESRRRLNVLEQFCAD